MPEGEDAAVAADTTGLEPWALPTWMSTVAPAAGPDGAWATRVVPEVTVNEAGVLPKRTEVAPAKLYPVTVTVLDPTTGPLPGSTPVTTGQTGGEASTDWIWAASGEPHPVARS